MSGEAFWRLAVEKQKRLRLAKDKLRSKIFEMPLFLAKLSFLEGLEFQKPPQSFHDSRPWWLLGITAQGWPAIRDGNAGGGFKFCPNYFVCRRVSSRMSSFIFFRKGQITCKTTHLKPPMPIGFWV